MASHSVWNLPPLHLAIVVAVAWIASSALWRQPWVSWGALVGTLVPAVALGTIVYFVQRWRLSKSRP